jgi:hypothetical protein
MDGMEIEFANHLVEDSNNDALSYTDCKSDYHLYLGENERIGNEGRRKSG